MDAGAGRCAVFAAASRRDPTSAPTRFIGAADKVDSACQVGAIDHDFDLVAVLNLADWSAGKSLGGDMADAGSGGDAAEARIGQDGNVLAVGKLLERGSNLINLLHARARRPAADENDRRLHELPRCS